MDTEKRRWVDTPKTANSIRAVPLMDSTLQLLKAYQEEMRANNPGIPLKNAFLFPKEGDILQARDPNSVTRRVKRFMKLHGLPDMSPHDLRHPNVKPKTQKYLSIIADKIRSCVA